MAILTILEFPDSRLRKVAEPVAAVDDAIRRLADDMLETMYAAPGVGLAATQVNVQRRLVVMDVSEAHNQPLVFINPEITVLDPALCDYDEGCLSVPGFYEKVSRPERIRVRALDRDGTPFVLEPTGLMAVCIQHEVDHLDGKLFVDYLSALKRQRIRQKLTKQQQSAKLEQSARQHGTA
ncbi:MAG TPA: peptide deformylase [Porticoccaceae bacterium]|nr:peptide deformylase [Porticoccaceae bacterium]